LAFESITHHQERKNQLVETIRHKKVIKTRTNIAYKLFKPNKLLQISFINGVVDYS